MMVQSLKDTQSKLHLAENDANGSVLDTSLKSEMEVIAIIGIGCRFPGNANSPEAFWQLLRNGVDTITEVPKDRWNMDLYYDPNRAKPGKIVTRWGGFLDQVDQFDANFFGISPREAAHIDPQQRLLLEVCWEALEDGGQVPDRLIGSKTGVFMGAFTLDYKVIQFRESNRELITGHTATGTMMTLIANRISYTFDFRGPSVAVDTACSSSLVAIHLACQSLRNGECQLALAGGVNVMVTPEYTIAESKAGMLSPDGRCKTFDARANGYVRGEGAGVIVLKPLSQALVDEDPIYAVIRGSAVNQDGRTSGITVPRREAQEALIREAYSRAGVSPKDVQYVEAHGTGTPVGDPLEANAIGTVLSSDRPAGNECIIGSVKTNIGHTEAAAGVAGIIKAALCLKHQEIFPHLHFQSANPQISFEALRLRIPETLMPFPKGTGRALAGVNSFGFGGTNAHVILEESPHCPYDSQDEVVNENSPYLLPLSARSPEALQAFAQAFHQFLADRASIPRLRDICYSASLRRTHHPHRLALMVHSCEELMDRLDSFLAGEAGPGMSSSQGLQGNDATSRNSASRPIAFVLSGMGPQWWAMGRELIEREPVFRQAMEECDALMREMSGWSVLEEMMADETHSRMADTEFAQPANFALQVALAALWRSWGIEPDAVVGHSAGEAAAAYVAGALSLEDAVRVNFNRSRLQQRMTGQGNLIAVGLSLAEAEQAIAGYEDRVSIAAINSPKSVALVGDRTSLEEVVKPLQEQQIFCRFVYGEVPYHSRYMEPLREELLESLQELKPRSASISLFSTSLGRRVDGQELNADYWWKNVRDSVLFGAAMDDMIQAGYTTFLELSPHPVLGGVISQCLLQHKHTGTVLPSLHRRSPDLDVMLTSLGMLYAQGFSINWEALYPEKGRFVRLPSYPWQRERYWQESKESEQYRLGAKVHPLLGSRLKSPHPLWASELDTRQLAYLEDHRIQGAVVYPGAAYVEMGFAAAREAFGIGVSALSMENIEFYKALFLPEGETCKLQILVDPNNGSFRIYSQSNAVELTWTLHARGTVKSQSHRLAKQVELDIIQGRCLKEIDKEACYRQFCKLGLEYGETFRGIEKLWQGGNEALAQVRIPDDVQLQMSNYLIHPAVLDLCFQVLAAALPFDNDTKNTTVYMPTGVDDGWVTGRLYPHMWIHAVIKEQGGDLLKGDIQLLDEDGNVLIEIRGCHAKALKDESRTASSIKAPGYYEFKWQPQNRVSQAEVSSAQQTEQPGSWLIFTDSNGVGKALAERLTVEGDRCVFVSLGKDNHISDDGYHYWINPSQPEAFQRLLNDVLGEDHPPCRGLVHLWSLDIAAPEATTVASLREAELLGCNAILHLVQTLSQSTWRKAPRLWLVTRGSQQVEAVSASLSVAQASLWGMARVLGHQEHRDLWGGIIDLDPKGSIDEVAALLEEIWHNDEEDQIAFRAGQRYVGKLLNSGDLALPLLPTFRPDGSYLITGGFGSLGLLVACWLVKRGARRLILMGRNSLPPRSEWNQLEVGSQVASQVAAVRELEAMGASVHLAAADVTDEKAVTTFLEAYEQEGWPPIRGVIHSAGTALPQLMLQMSADDFNKVLRPKVLGAWILHRLFEEKPLDFFVMFSSIASLVVSTGQGNYAAGNAFMDALAHYRQSKGLPGVSINWGPWAEVGMATKLDLLEFFEKRGNYTISPEEGLAILGHLMGQNRPQVAIVAADWPVVAQKNYVMGIAPLMLSELVAEGQQASTTAPTSGFDKESFLQQFQSVTNESERQLLLESHLQGLAARVLRIDRSRFTTEQPLNTLGLDSMMAIELKNYVENSLGIGIAVVDLLSGPSISQLATKLMPQIQVEADADDDESGDVLALLEQLSEEEVSALFDEVNTQLQSKA